MKNHFIRNAISIVFICVVAVGFSTSAYSFTECTVEIEKIGVQDKDYVIIYFENGGMIMLGPTSPNPQNSLMLATTALLENRSIIVRYEDDNVECDSEYKKVTGIYIVK